MTKDEALDLALEALELINLEFVCANGSHHAKKDRHEWDEDCPITDRWRKAITAIKQARALDKKAENARELGLDYELAPVQEPVKFLANGTRFKTSESPYGVCINGLPKELSGRWIALVAAEDNCHLKLTTPPAAQRTWVGLTDEQIHEACWESYVDPVTGECSTGDRECAVRWALAKLKELNT